MYLTHTHIFTFKFKLYKFLCTFKSLYSWDTVYKVLPQAKPMILIDTYRGGKKTWKGETDKG